jgi:DNA modification methylase
MLEINKIYNEDCLEGVKKIDGESIDCIICDLPYFGVVEADFDNQWKDENDYLQWVEKLVVEYVRVLKPGGNIFLFTSRQMNRKICNILDKYLIEKRIIIWARKRGFNNTRGRALASGYEPIAYYSKRGAESTFNNIKIKPNSKRKEYTEGMLKDGVSLSDVWTDIPALPHNSKEKTNHPTQKPISLMERIVSISTNEGDIVLDGCMGSGSTGVACLNLGRDFIGFEIDKGFYDIAKERISEVQNEIKLF